MKNKISEAERLYNMTEHERMFWNKGIIVAGMDEVGRGPLAGPVVAACVALNGDALIEYVNDSKKVTELRRKKLSPIIKENAIAYGIGYVDNEVIDEINILNATKQAFKIAFEQMNSGDIKIRNVLVDAVKDLDIDAEQHPLIHGDALSYLIAAASIIAKVDRDEYMMKMHEIYPEYGFDKNKGYGTKQHIDALKKYGPCPIHRKSFIKNFVK